MLEDIAALGENYAVFQNAQYSGKTIKKALKLIKSVA